MEWIIIGFKMKGSGRKSNNQQISNYRSEVSRVSSGGREKFQLQNIKDFKCQIDHQIAKCLDTLDRQGLKFLKETLRASKLFALNTQELSNSHPIGEESVAQVEEIVSEKKVQAPKKIEPAKVTQVKKGTKVEVDKKPSSAQRGRPGSKKDLGDKINKKLQSLNIKTVKRDYMPIPTTKQPAAKSKKVEIGSGGQIAQEIDVEEHIQVPAMRESIPIQIENEEEPMKQSSSDTSFNVKQIAKVEHSAKAEPKQNFVYIPEPNDYVSKPFYKKGQKKQHTHNHQQQKEHKDYGIQEIKAEQIKEDIKPEEVINESKHHDAYLDLHKMNHQHEEKALKDGEVYTSKVQSMPQQGEELTEARISPELMSLIGKIRKLPPNKMLKLQRVLQKLEDPLLQTSMVSLASDTSKQEVSYMKPSILQKVSRMNQSQARERSKSKSRLEKQEKASSIKNSMLKRSKVTAESPLYRGKIVQNVETEKSVPLCQSRKVPENEGKQIQAEVPQFNENSGFKLEQDILSASVSMQESGQKLIKINKKKSAPTDITIKILSSNGHSSLVGLSSILIYNISGELVPIAQHNLKETSTKTLKLFTENNDAWVTSLSTATIKLQGINQLIGGIRIINFNKSELENNKQADMLEIMIDRQLHWRGQLRGGSYKEGEKYITDVKVATKDFQFPNCADMASSRLKADRNESSLLKSKLKEAPQQPKKISWLQKEQLSKIREYEEMEREREESKVKKIQSVRNTVANQNSETSPIKDIQVGPELYRQNNLSGFKIKEEHPFSLEVQGKAEKGSKAKLQDSNDILIDMSRSIHLKKKSTKEESALKEEPKREEKSRKKESEIALKMKQKQQDEEFEQILRSLEKREKDKPVPEKKRQISRQRVQQKQQGQIVESKDKKPADNCFEEFMKDSLFNDVAPKTKQQHSKGSFSKKQDKIVPSSARNPVRHDLDNLIDELNDVIGGENAQETGQEFTIPELPSGKEITMLLLSNWGNQQHIGLNGLEFFDSKGDIIRPKEVISSSMPSYQLLDRLFKTELMTSDENRQVKLNKSSKIVLHFVFGVRFELAALRVWNYSGHRVHNNIGVRKCHLKMDNQYIFSGQIRQSSGSSEDAHKYCEYILFTDNSAILNKIGEKDWLNRKQRNNEEEAMLFKSTLQNFHRPPTRNDEESLKREVIQEHKEPIKLPKRMCFEYEPPQLPEGFRLSFILHSSWGDRFFVGLNGIQIFNEKGEVVTAQHLSQIKADPSSIAKLEGYERDKRVVSNLINGRNTTSQQANTWLSPLLSDVQKIEKGRPNLITMQYSKGVKIAGINFYNYTKTAERGVREIQIYLDNYLLYRGYLRKYDRNEGIIHTTVNFTKEQSLLQCMNYVGYHQDAKEQDVGLVNEQQVVKQTMLGVPQHNLSRPMTGKLLP